MSFGSLLLLDPGPPKTGESMRIKLMAVIGVPCGSAKLYKVKSKQVRTIRKYVSIGQSRQIITPTPERSLTRGSDVEA